MEVLKNICPLASLEINFLFNSFNSFVLISFMKLIASILRGCFIKERRNKESHVKAREMKAR